MKIMRNREIVDDKILQNQIPIFFDFKALQEVVDKLERRGHNAIDENKCLIAYHSACLRDQSC